MKFYRACKERVIIFALNVLMMFSNTYAQGPSSPVISIDASKLVYSTSGEYCDCLDSLFIRGEAYKSRWGQKGSVCKWNFFDKERVGPAVGPTSGVYDIYIVSAADVGATKADIANAESAALRKGYINCPPSVVYQLVANHWKNKKFFSPDKPSYIVTLDKSNEVMEITHEYIVSDGGIFAAGITPQDFWLGEKNMQAKRFIFAKKRK